MAGSSSRERVLEAADDGRRRSSAPSASATGVAGDGAVTDLDPRLSTAEANRMRAAADRASAVTRRAGAAADRAQLAADREALEAAS